MLLKMRNFIPIKPVFRIRIRIRIRIIWSDPDPYQETIDMDPGSAKGLLRQKSLYFFNF